MAWLKRGLIAVGAIFLLLMVIGLVMPRDASAPQPAKDASAERPEQQPISAPAKPASLDARVRAVAKEAMPNADIDGLNYEGVQVSDDQDDNGNANGRVIVSTNYHLAKLPTADDDMAAFSASLYRSLFALAPTISHIMISFNGPIKDIYGHTNERSYIDYGMERSTFEKIDWSGFDAAGLCAFLRAENSDVNMCGLWPGILAQGVEPPHR